MYLHELLKIKDFALPMNLHGTFSDNLKDVFDKYILSFCLCPLLNSPYPMSLWTAKMSG